MGSLMDDLFQGRETAPTTTTRASGVRSGRDSSNRRNIDTTRDSGATDTYDSARPPSVPDNPNRAFYSVGNVNAWRRYQDNLRSLKRYQNTYGTQTIDRQGNIQYRYESQERLNTARSLRANVFDYQEDTQGCNGGDGMACERVGRRIGNDRQIPTQYTGQNRGGSYTPATSSNPDLVEATVTPTGDVEPPPPEAPQTADHREADCNANGGSWSNDGGGGCYYTAPVIPAGGSEEHNPHPDEIERPTAGGGSHDQQGQGSIHQDGRDGGQSQGEHTIHDLPSGGVTPKNFKRNNFNPNRERLNTILALASLREPLEQKGRFLF